MAQLLEQLAALGGLKDIADPAAWEREERQDRLLHAQTTNALMSTIIIYATKPEYSGLRRFIAEKGPRSQ